MKETRNVRINVSSNVGTQMNKGTVAAGGLSTGLKGVAGSAGAATGGIKAMAAALISSGIGAVVVLLGSMVAGFSSVIRKSSEFSKELSGLKAVLGENGDNIAMGKLADDAKRLGSTTAFTATQVVQLQTEFAKLGFTTDAILDTTEATLQLAAASGTELAEAAAVAGQTLNGFGLATSETQRVVDVMAKSFSSSALDLDKFKESMKLIAPIAKVVKVPIEQASAAISVLADTGIAGSMAGTQLRKVMSDLAMKTGKSFRESLDLTAEKLANATSDAEKLAIAKGLVGDRAKGSLIALANNREKLDELTLSYEHAEGAAKKMAETKLDNLSGDLTKLSSAWEGLQLSIESGNGALARFARSVVQSVTAITSFFTATNTAVDSLQDERLELFKVESQLMNTNTSQSDRIKLITDLQRQYPAFLNNLNAETVTNKQLAGELKKVNQMLVNKILLAEEDAKIEEQAQKNAKIKRNQLEQQDEALGQLSKIASEYSDKLDGVEISGTLTEQIEKQSAALKDMILNDKDLSSSEKMDMKSARSMLEYQKMRVESMDAFNEVAVKKGEEAVDKKLALEKRLGLGQVESVTKTGNKVSDIYDEFVEGSVTSEGKGNNQKKDLREKFLAKLTKMEEDSEDSVEKEKLERRRQRHLKELDTISLNTEQKRLAAERINALYDILEEDRFEKAQQKRKDKVEQMFGKDADPLVEINKKEQEHLAEMAFIELTETEKEELKKRIKDHYQAERDQVKLDADQVKIDDIEAELERERQLQEGRRRLIMGALDSAAAAAGEETAMAKALHGIKLAMQLQELGMKMGIIKDELAIKAQAAMTEAGIEQAKVGTAIAGGMAETSKVGFPWNVITMAGYALQAASLVSSFAKSKKKLGSIANRAGGSGAGGGGGSTAPQAPSFNVIGRTSADGNMVAETIASVNSAPMRAYVVESDVTTAQAGQRATDDVASIG
jgi:TP901 family phage tail tape measure protein